MEKDLVHFIEEHISLTKDLVKEIYLLHWHYDTTGDESVIEKKEQLENKYYKIYSDQERFKRLRAIFDANQIQDPLLKRQLKLLLSSYTMHQANEEEIQKSVSFETKITSIFNHFRAELDGEKLNDNQIQKILSQETDNDRRKRAWEASKQVGEQVGPVILELVRLRNKVAKKAGYSDYYEMSLACKELSEKKLFETLGKLKELTDEPFKAFKTELDKNLADKYGITPQEMRPWHYGDPFFQQLPAHGKVDIDHFFQESNIEELTQVTFDSIGMEVEDIMKNASLYPKEGKCQHAYCSMVDKEEKDIRILCNIDQNTQWVRTMLHEFGHGVYDKYLGDDLPYLLKIPAHTLSTEAMAIMMEELAFSPKWLKEIAKVPSEQVEKVQDGLMKETKYSKLVFTRWGLVMVFFERELYKNPDQDLNTLWWDIVEKFQFITRPENRNQADWASKIHFAIAPVYYQNYIYGQMIAYQLYGYIQENIGNGQLFNNKELGEYLIEKYFSSGSTFDWNTTLKKATGKKLHPESFAKALA